MDFIENYECPFCHTLFNRPEEWEDGECPNCHKKYWWDEFCTEDYSDCWTSIEWNWTDK